MNGLVSNVYRGSIAAAVPWSYDLECLASEMPFSELTDNTTPPLGTLFYYLVSAVNECDESEVHSDSAGTPIFATTLGLPLYARVTISLLVLTPAGAMLGLFFPLGMLRFGDDDKPWYWAINGVFGVVASVFSLALSMEFGYALVGFLSAAIYLLAWLCLRERPGRLN